MAASTLVESDQLEIAENAMTSLEVPPVARRNESNMRIADRLEADSGRLYLNGMQALVRFPLVQAKADRAAGLKSGTFISGYPGSPLGGYDLQLQRNRKLLEQHHVFHRPGENEELAATTLIGTQLLDRYPHERYDGVTGIWYGKGPGLDRSGDALRHGNFGGTSTHGAVVILSGEDHESKSSTLPHEQEYSFQHAGIPVLYPSSVEEFLTYGQHAIAMSRYSGLWVAMKLVGQLCDGGQTLDLASTAVTPTIPRFQIGGRSFRKVQDNMYFPGKTIETERHVFEERHPAAVAYMRANELDRVVVSGGNDQIGIVTAGKSYADVVQAFSDMGLDDAALTSAGVRLIKLGAIYPVDSGFLRDNLAGMNEVYVVEEKRGMLEEKVKDALCNLAAGPRIYGKRDGEGRELFPAYGVMDADLITSKLGPLLRGRVRDTVRLDARTSEIAEITARAYPSVHKRSPNYCSGCPHNVSTTLLDGQVAWGAPGCHIFAAIMDDQPNKQIDATFPLGGEGVGWIGLSPFTDMPHVVQNQGDGSLFHSSYLNIRFSIAAGVDMTYKILFNGYVANTGAQEAVGAKDVPKLVQLLALEGASKIAIIARDPKVYARHKFPSVVSVHDAFEVDKVLADLAATKGTTIFLYDGECANERRRRQKRGKAPKSTEFVVINEDVCENCGDCGEVTNCMSLHKADTEFGQKTRIHQSSCNQDTSCLKGDCPSFVTVTSDEGLTKLSPPDLNADDLPESAVPEVTRPFHVYVPGVGGTGVLTINALLCWAATLDGYEVASYDQTGSAQKWGAVLSSLIISPLGAGKASNKAGLGAADLYLAVDAMASADKANLDRCSPGKTAALINTGLLPSGDMIRDVDLTVDVNDLVTPIRQFVDPGRTVVADAKFVAEGLFGDYMSTNMVAVGMAFQAGLLPISAESLEEAIAVNGAAVSQNLQAFRYGRLAQADPDRVRSLIVKEPLDAAGESAVRREALPARYHSAYDDLLVRVSGLEEEDRRLLAVRVAELIEYQDVAYANDYVDFVMATAEQERHRSGSEHNLGVTRTVIRNLHKLMAYKDEYEVARLHLRGRDHSRVGNMFDGQPKIRYNLHPPVLRALGMKKKLGVPAWLAHPAFTILVRMRGLRGGALDVFGRDQIRREERALIGWYRDLVEEALPQLVLGNRDAVMEMARLPEEIRGYEQIKKDNIVKAKHRAEILRGRLKNTKSLPVLSPNTTKEIS